MENFFVALYRYFSRHRAVFCTVLLVSALVFGYFASRIHFEENIIALLPKTDESKRSAVAFADIKVKDKIFIQITGDGSICAPEDLASAMDTFIEMLNAEDSGRYIDNILYKFDADDIMNLVDYATGALPCHIPESLYPVLDSMMNAETIDSLVAGGSPVSSFGSYALVDGHLLSTDSTVAIAYIAPAFPSLDTKAGTAMENMLGDVAESFHQENPSMKVLYHGAAIEGTYNAKQIKKDLATTVGISLVIICIFICYCFRGRRTLLLLLAPVLYGALFSLACIYWIKGSMSFIAIGIGALVLGVALSYCLHVFTHYKFVSDPETVIREQTRPVLLGCLTTIGSFAGLLFTSSELLSDFGLFASFTLVGTTFFALAFLPQFFNKKEEGRNEKAFSAINAVNSYPLDRNKAVVIILGAIICVTAVASRNVRFDSDLSNIGHREPKVVESENLYSEKVNGQHHPQYFAACSSDLDSALVMNKAVHLVLDSLKRAGAIFDFSSPRAFLIPDEDQRENISAWKEFWTPERVERGFSLLTAYAEKYDWEEKTGFDIPSTFRLMTEVDYEPQSLYDSGALPDSFLSNYIENVDGKWLVMSSVMLDSRRDLKVDRIVADAANVVVLDPFFYTGDMVEIVHDDFNVVLLISSLFVLLVLILSFRSIVISLIAFLPMFVSWYVVQGMMALFGIEFNLVNIMISSFIFGIGVDYSIFVMDGLVNKEKMNDSRLILCHKAAILFSGVTLLVVIASLLFARHPAIYSIGISTIIGMTSTILITYAFQPLLFRLAMKNAFIRKRALKERQ